MSGLVESDISTASVKVTAPADAAPGRDNALPSSVTFINEEKFPCDQRIVMPLLPLVTAIRPYLMNMPIGSNKP
jgi:hypothetical protein